MAVLFGADQSPEGYNDTTGAFYNLNGTPNHAVAIVGWDDNYSKDNFNSDMRPTKDGAYIALNSWGTAYGNKGYYYISYEDKYVENDDDKEMMEYFDNNGLLDNNRDADLLFIRLDKNRNGKIDYPEVEDELQTLY